MKEPLEKTIERVKKMEGYFEMVGAFQKVSSQNEKLDTNLEKAVQELAAYLESGEWLADYECDERGELPRDLKRGVLSQDGLYNLLEELRIKKLL